MVRLSVMLLVVSSFCIPGAHALSGCARRHCRYTWKKNCGEICYNGVCYNPPCGSHYVRRCETFTNCEFSGNVVMPTSTSEQTLNATCFERCVSRTTTHTTLPPATTHNTQRGVGEVVGSGGSGKAEEECAMQCVLDTSVELKMLEKNCKVHSKKHCSDFCNINNDDSNSNNEINKNNIDCHKVCSIKHMLACTDTNGTQTLTPPNGKTDKRTCEEISCHYDCLQQHHTQDEYTTKKMCARKCRCTPRDERNLFFHESGGRRKCGKVRKLRCARYCEVGGAACVKLCRKSEVEQCWDIIVETLIRSSPSFSSTVSADVTVSPHGVVACVVAFVWCAVMVS